MIAITNRNSKERKGETMRRYLFFLLVIPIFFSCRNNNLYYDMNYDGEPNYYKVYLVDTIEIKDPILLNYGTSNFVMSNNKTVLFLE